METGKLQLFPTSLILILTILILISNYGETVEIESAKEMSCFTPNENQITAIDSSWLSKKKVYYSRMSRLDLYLAAVDLTGLDPEELNEDTVYYDGCIVWEHHPGGYLESGFGIKNKQYLATPVDNSLGTFTFSSLDGGYHGTSYRVLTDNQTFSLNLSCYPDLDQMTWSVGTTLKSLPDETVALIHDTVTSFGFQKKQFTGLRFEGCPDGSSYFPNDSGTLPKYVY